MQVDQAIRSRKTEKLMSSHPLETTLDRSTVEQLLEVAGLAPFHRVCEEHHRQQTLDGIEPWRFYSLDARTCRSLATHVQGPTAGKIPFMLNSANCLIMATWLPNTGEAPAMGDEPGFVVTLANMEHIAAASAAIQNLLLAATARGISNYWSSGGVLRTSEVFQLLGIPRTEILLGAIFLFPEPPEGIEVATSKLRELRTERGHWNRWVELAE